MAFKRVNLTEGAIGRSLIQFALPILLSNVLQQLYNTADLLIVGRFAGHLAMASVGAIGAVTSMLIALATGLATGCTVVVSQRYGAQDYDGLYKTVHTALALALAAGAVLTVIGVVLSPIILEMMGTPPDILSGAVLYMRIYFGGITPTLIYNMGAGILNAVGDSKRPFTFLAIASLTNIAFDVLFIAGLKGGVAGAAVATVLAQSLAATLVLLSLIRSTTPYRLFVREIRIHRPILRSVVRVGLPAGVQGVVISLANTFIQAAINGFGPDAVAGSAVAGRVDGLVFVVMTAFGISAMTFTGQNVGAKKIDRVRRGLFTAIAMDCLLAIALAALVLSQAAAVVSWFNDNSEVKRFAVRMMTYILPLYFVFGINDVMGGFLRGRGKALPPMVINLICMTLFRLLWLWIVLPYWHTIDGVYIAYPLSWVLTCLVTTTYIIISSGRWLRNRDPERRTTDVEHAL